MSESPQLLLEVKNSRESEETPAVMEQVFASLGTPRGRGGFLSSLFGKKHANSIYSFELVSVNNGIHFFVGVSPHNQILMESQLTAHYPKLLVSQSPDYAPHFFSLPHVTAQLVMGNSYYYPLKTHKDVRDLDLLASVLGQMAKLPAGEAVAVQICVSPAGTKWQRHAASVVAAGIPDPSSTLGRTKAHPHARLIETKISQVGFQTAIRVVTVATDVAQAKTLLYNIAGSYGVFTLGEGNSLGVSEPAFWQKKKMETALLSRSFETAPKGNIFGAAELATLWHPPGLALSGIKNISWGAQLMSDAPDNLPIATDDEEEKKHINFFARTEFRNKPATFGIKQADRRKHLYVVGKTGTGKSTMIANMAINDMRNGEGVAVIDPHGDLSDILLDYVPSHRINDIAYLDPSDVDFPFHLNPLEVKSESMRELAASGIVSIFHKLYQFSWGPRLEYILRNTLLTLLYIPDTTLLQVPELLTNDAYRSKVVEKLSDQVLKNYWLNEFNKMPPNLKSEAISPILNKVGQFLSSQTVRNVVGHPKSTIDLETMMNQGKIIIVNLSVGKLGEDNSALLGSMIITKMQLAAMNRVHMKEEERKDFYLYVDEFQTFATSSFVNILSEARKYRLDLILANQYIGQIDETVQEAIFGNVGSLASFSVGSIDARILSREFGEKYEEGELVSLGNYQIALKLSIDNRTSPPFAATTLPLPHSRNQNREKVVRASRERYTKKSEVAPPLKINIVEPVQQQPRTPQAKQFSQTPQPPQAPESPHAPVVQPAPVRSTVQSQTPTTMKAAKEPKWRYRPAKLIPEK